VQEEEQEVDSDEEKLLEIDFSKKKFIKEGRLKKKSELRNAWKDRWFRLYSEGPLFYFENEEDTEPAGVIHLKGARLYPHTQKNGVIDPLMFSMRYGKATFLLAAHNIGEKTEWVNVIKENISGEELPEDAQGPLPTGSIYVKPQAKKKKDTSPNVELNDEGDEVSTKKKKKSSKKKI